MNGLNQFYNYLKNHKYRYWIALVLSPILMFLMGLFFTFVFLWGTGSLGIKNETENAMDERKAIMAFDFKMPDMSFYGVKLSDSSDANRAKLAVEALSQQGVLAHSLQSEDAYSIVVSLGRSENLNKSYLNAFISEHTAFSDAMVSNFELQFETFKVYAMDDASFDAFETKLINFFEDTGDFFMKMNAVETLPYAMIEEHMKDLAWFYHFLAQHESNTDTELTLFLQKSLNTYNSIIEAEGDLNQFMNAYVGQILELTAGNE